MKTTIKKFEHEVMHYYNSHGRHQLPWRKTRDAYSILVSEFMLQQTQVDRVVPKYESFLKTFPTLEALAQAHTGKLLEQWKGLGYNSRALRLRDCAKKIVKDFDGNVPRTYKELIGLPGIGPASATDILAFAFNIYSIGVETNIRTAVIHHFFRNQTIVSDKDIIDILANIYPPSPREWYWALMDYGTHLKSAGYKYNHQSKHFTKQSKFEGSHRQLRSLTLSAVLERKMETLNEIYKEVIKKRTEATKIDIQNILHQLENEGFIYKSGNKYKV